MFLSSILFRLRIKQEDMRGLFGRGVDKGFCRNNKTVLDINNLFWRSKTNIVINR